MSGIEVSLRGTLQKAAEMPYGTHMINNYGQPYALTSEVVDLDEYVGREVTVVGDQLEGYAGPELVMVEALDVH